jgi:hypothetical protein
MEYELHCECGATLIVRETAAGTKERCQCGLTLVVPSLHELRRRAGLPVPELPPEKIVETLLLAGKLPQEDYCVLCGVTTEGVICCTTECERAYVPSSHPSWRWAFWGIGLIVSPFDAIKDAIIASHADEGREWGKDRVFTLPLRVCVKCRHDLIGLSALKAALERVPLYRRLLEKYPEARITLSSQYAVPRTSRSAG